MTLWFRRHWPETHSDIGPNETYVVTYFRPYFPENRHWCACCSRPEYPEVKGQKTCVGELEVVKALISIVLECQYTVDLCVTIRNVKSSQEIPVSYFVEYNRNHRDLVTKSLNGLPDGEYLLCK